MMGTKVRRFGPLEGVTLDELVPRNHFYRHVEQSLDLSFVRELVQSCYAPSGRPSIDPVVFFLNWLPGASAPSRRCRYNRPSIYSTLAT